MSLPQPISSQYKCAFRRHLASTSNLAGNDLLRTTPKRMAEWLKDAWGISCTPKDAVKARIAVFIQWWQLPVTNVALVQRLGLKRVALTAPEASMVPFYDLVPLPPEQMSEEPPSVGCERAYATLARECSAARSFGTELLRLTVPQLQAWLEMTVTDGNGGKVPISRGQVKQLKALWQQEWFKVPILTPNL